MATIPGDRIHELAIIVARSVATDAGISAIPHIDRSAAVVRLANEPDLKGLSWREACDACHDIAALARTAIVTITIPEEQ